MAGSVLEVQPGKQPSAAMPAHHHVTLGAKGVGQSAVTLGYVAVQKWLGTRDISGDGDEQKSTTAVKKINHNKQVPSSCCHQGQSLTRLVQPRVGMCGWSSQCPSTEAPLCAW